MRSTCTDKYAGTTTSIIIWGIRREETGWWALTHYKNIYIYSTSKTLQFHIASFSLLSMVTKQLTETLTCLCAELNWKCWKFTLPVSTPGQASSIFQIILLHLFCTRNKMENKWSVRSVIGALVIALKVATPNPSCDVLSRYDATFWNHTKSYQTGM
jgi:hypothetical protein